MMMYCKERYIKNLPNYIDYPPGDLAKTSCIALSIPLASEACGVTPSALATTAKLLTPASWWDLCERW